MSNRALQWAFDLPIVGAEKGVLVALANCMNDKTGRCDPSHDTLARHAGVDERTVRRAIAGLEAKCLLEVVDRPGRTSHYTLAVTSKDNTPDTTPDLRGIKPWTPRPTPRDVTPDATPDHPGHHARPTPDMVSKTPDTTPDEPKEPEVQPEGTKREVRNAQRAIELLAGKATTISSSSTHKPTRPPKTKTPVDPAWKPDARNWGYATSEGIADVAVEVEKFRDWHLKHGTLYADWNAAWRMWCRKAKEFRQEREPQHNGTRPPLSPPAGIDLRYFGRPASEVAKLPRPRIGSSEYHAWVAAHDGRVTPAPSGAPSEIRGSL